MPRKLKVFRTSAGFDDAYVAAPSRKAALAAWGADADLFARGAAEEVTDPALMEEPLARPGEIIRLSRGDLGAHLKALPPRRKKPAAKKTEEAAKPAKPRKAQPPPSRNKVEAAEAALAAAREKHAAEASELEAEMEAIERQLAALRAKQDKELGKLQRTLEAEREKYRAALERWSG